MSVYNSGENINTRCYLIIAEWSRESVVHEKDGVEHGDWMGYPQFNALNQKVSSSPFVA